MDHLDPAKASAVKMVEKKSGIPVLAFGIIWLAYALFFPLYRLSHFIGAGLLSLAAYLLLNKLIPAKVEYVPVTQAAQATGNAEADALLREGERLLSGIAARRAGLKSSAVAGKIQRLEGLVARILAFVAQNPASTGDLRKFMSYYLPTLLKLAESYATFESQGVAGENLSAAMAKIEAMLDTMAPAFERQLDALFADRALDVTTDITVMESMLAQEGLSDGQNTLSF